MPLDISMEVLNSSLLVVNLYYAMSLFVSNFLVQDIFFRMTSTSVLHQCVPTQFSPWGIEKFRKDKRFKILLQLSLLAMQVTLEVKGEAQILNLAEKLKAGGIAHKLWIEQPENIPTCLATKPYPKSVVSPFFKKLKLCK